MARPSKMFFRLLLRAATVRRSRTLTALLALIVAATLATALLDIYSDIGAKLGGDFRKFGANVVISAPGGLSHVEITSVETKLGPNAIVVPEAFAIARTASGKSIVVAGIDLEKAKRLNSWWSVTLWPNGADQALVGARAGALLSKETDSTLEFGGKTISIQAVGQLTTGGEEDSRVYLSLEEFQQWTGVRPTVLELAIPGSQAEVSTSIEELRSTLPGTISVQPVLQIVEAETRVLGKTRFILLLSTIAITLTVALCVLATLTASVLERRKDYAVMKALGSSQAAVNTIFLGESLSLGILGAIAGFAAGCGLAMWIGRANFHAAVEPRLDVFPSVLAGCVGITLVSAIVPLTLLQKTEPAAILKGD